MKINKELFSKLVNEKYAVNVQTQEEYDSFMVWLEENTEFEWLNGTKPTGHKRNWSYYETGTCVILWSAISCADVGSCLQINYTIIPFNDLFNLNNDSETDNKGENKMSKKLSKKEYAQLVAKRKLDNDFIAKAIALYKEQHNIESDRKFIVKRADIEMVVFFNKKQRPTLFYENGEKAIASDTLAVLNGEYKFIKRLGDK